MCGYEILVTIWKWSKLLNFVPFIKRTHVNHVYNPISLFWLTFAVFQSMKTNFKLSQFSRFLLRCLYGILVKIWKWPNLLYFVPFNKKTHVNHFYNRIWSFSNTFIFLQSRKTNFKISQFSRFLLSREYSVENFFIFFHSSRKHLLIMFTIDFDQLYSLSHFYTEAQLRDFC